MGCCCVDGQVALIYVGEEYTLSLGALYHGVKPPSEVRGRNGLRGGKSRSTTSWMEWLVAPWSLIYICLGRVHTVILAL